MKHHLSPRQIAKLLESLTPEQIEQVKAEADPVKLNRVKSYLRFNYGGGRPPMLRPCPHCKKEMSARELWAHESACYAKHHPEAPRKVGRPMGSRKKR